MAPIRRLGSPFWETANASAFFFFLDRLADDVGHIGVAFFLFLDEGGIVQALVAYLDVFLFSRLSLGVGCRRLLALLFGLGILERNKFRVTGLRHNALGLRCWRGPCGYRLGSRACRRRRGNRYNFARIGRNHRRLVEVVKFTAGIG